MSRAVSSSTLRSLLAKLDTVVTPGFCTVGVAPPSQERVVSSFDDAAFAEHKSRVGRGAGMTSLMVMLMAVGCSAPTDPGLQHAEDITEDPPATGTPGQVSDLIVTDSSGTSVTLSFTEVDDGNGRPADYAVRAHIGPMDWGSAEEVTHGSCAAPLKGSTVGTRLSCTVENLLPETTYTFQVAAFRGTFQAGAVYGALSNVVPDMGEVLPPSGTRENEPDSYQLISSRSFDQIGEGDWTDNTNDSDYSVGVTETGSASDLVARARYRAGTTGGGSPIGTGTALSFGDRSELYVEFWLKYSDNFQGHDSGVNKILFITDKSYGGGGDPAFIAAYGANSSTLTLQVRLQGPGSEHSASIGSGNLRPNLGSGSIERGQWHRVELVLVMNTGTNSNGEAHAWLDGSKVIEYRDVRFEDASGSDHRFDSVRWGPIWGGIDDTVENDMYLWMDDIYVSGI